MAKAKVETSKVKQKTVRPALSPESRENQLISLAVDLVEQRLMDGTATSQETCHFLKLGSTRERLEQQKQEIDIELAKAKIEALKSNQRVEELFAEAITAMKTYQGVGDQHED